jgi:phosphatidylserine/phosphatidylglycerophosphate/cardiolipin synthase-like enzyme
MNAKVDSQKTQRPETTYIDEANREGYGTVQWLLEHETKEQGLHNITTDNEMDILICGEEGFANIAKDIAKAKGSIDIICWGFDPAMELVRNGESQWPRGGMNGVYGELLKNKGITGTKVRLLAWHDALGTFKQNNLVGYAGVVEMTSDEVHAIVGGMGGMDAMGGMGKKSVQDQRYDYCVNWWRDALAGKLKNIEVRFRNGTPAAVKASLAHEADAPSTDGIVDEDLLIKHFATHHQKPILIDYDFHGGSQAVGYIMGLNSVTDYWDTAAHKYSEPQRGQSWEGAGDKGFERQGLKPLQDYAARLRGEVLVSVNKNFCVAWDRAQKQSPKPEAGSLMDARKSIPPKLTNARKKLQLQVLRTQPEEGYNDTEVCHRFDKTIKRGYFHASSMARHYLYLENQYFFYEEWARHLKANREAFMNLAQGGKAKKADMGILHLMAVIPKPEDASMIPRTHDTLKSLGQGAAMPNQNKQFEDAKKTYEQQLAAQKSWDDKLAKLSPAAQRNAVQILGPRPQPRMDAVSQTSSEVKAAKEYDPKTDGKVIDTTTKKQIDKGVLMQDGKSLGMKVLICKMVSDGGLGKYRDIYIHSKLLMADDRYMTLGSANLNQRSMAADSEINIATDNHAKVKDLRQRVWALQAGGYQNAGGGDGSIKAIDKAYKDWKTLSLENFVKINRKKKDSLTGFIAKFEDPRSSDTRRG